MICCRPKHKAKAQPHSALFACAIVALVVAAAAPGARAQTWPSVSTELPHAGGGENDVAVVVGISAYPFLPKVPGAADNASDWFQYLVRVRGVPTERVTLLRDTEATRGRLERELRAAAAAAKPGATAWLVFIGHGAPAPSGDDGLLLGVDTQPNAESLEERGVRQTQALALLQAGKQAHSVVIFDACFSGRTGDGQQPLVEGLQATLPVRKQQKTEATVLSSSETFAGPLPGLPRPAFSYVLLGGLRGWADENGDKSVSVDEAIGYTRGVLRQVLKTTDRLPSARGRTNVVLAKQVLEPSPDVSAIVLGHCPAGTRWLERRCEKVRCPPETAWDGKACAATAAAVLCPPGTRWEGGRCVAATVACPPNTTWDGRQCAPEPRVSVLPVKPSPRPSPSPAPKKPEGPRNDADGDGIPDQLDQCPHEPEDKDGVEDEDGCPDPDNDRDGIPDVADHCPNVPETQNGWQDEDGCPDDLPAAFQSKHMKVNLRNGQILLAEQFKSGKATLPVDSKTTALLDEVATALKELIAARKAAHFVIQVHTDSAGAAKFNQELTAKRADALVQAMVKRGVDARLLEAQGKGEDFPIATNSTAEGRQQNRRVEIHFRNAR